MNKLNIKPVSVNECYRGRRFKTKTYEGFEKEMLYSLPKLKVPSGKLFIRFEFGVSSKRSDVDNLVKCTLDCLQKKYEFDDNRVYLLEVAKEEVKKGKEYIEFDISSLE